MSRIATHIVIVVFVLTTFSCTKYAGKGCNPTERYKGDLENRDFIPKKQKLPKRENKTF